MKQILTDELLQEAARRVQNFMLNALPEDDSELPSPSAAFEEKTEHLLRQFNRRNRQKKFLQHAAAWFLAILVGVSGWLALDTEARATVSKWIREISENKVSYRFFDTEDDTEISIDYAPQWLPDGYQTERVQSGYSTKAISYTNGENQIIFTCSVANSGTEKQVTGEAFRLEEVQIGDFSGDFYEESSAEESNGLIWMDEKSGVVFSILGFLDKETMVQIAESVVQIEE